MANVKYPDITVKLINEDSNAFAIISAVRKGLIRGKVSKEEIDKFQEEATSEDYDHLLATCMKWVEIE